MAATHACPRPTRRAADLVCVVVCCYLLPGAAAECAAPPGPSDVPGKPPPAVAAYARGEALPRGAVARLGTARLRAMCDSVHFSADGKTLVGVTGGCLVSVWEANSGKLRESRWLAGRPYRYRSAGGRTARSPDGNTLVISEGPSLQMWDIPSGKRLDVSLPTGRKNFERITLSDDRRLLLFAETVKTRFFPNGGGFGFEQQQNLVVWDTRTGQGRLLDGNEQGLVGLAISPDGKRVASSSSGRGTRVWDAATGKLLWGVPKYNAEPISFSPDGRHLIAGPGGGQSKWHVWDAATGKPSAQLRPPTVGYAWTFAVSPDAGRLLIPTVTDYVLWDLKAGRVLHRWPGANQEGKGTFAPDGRSVVTYDTILRRWDIDTGKPLYPDVGALGHTAPVRHLFFTPDGRRLASVDDATLRVWDVATSRPVHTHPLGKDRPDAWVLTPDGSTLLGVDERLMVHRWSVADGRRQTSYALDEAVKLNIGLKPLQVRVALDEDALVVSAWPRSPEYQYRKYSFSFWDLKTGRLRHWGGDPGRDYRGEFSSLSPDGRLAAVDGNLYNTLSGECRVRVPGGRDRFSPDGRLLAVVMKQGVRVYEVATGQPLLDLPGAETRCAAFSPDGRRYACADRHRLLVWDLQTGKVIADRGVPGPGDRDGYWTRADILFSPDGRAVATGHTDGTIFLWAVPPAPTRRDRLTRREVDALWSDLAHEHPGKGYAAVWRLCEDPEEAARVLQKRFPLITPSADRECRALIQQLDSDLFKEREAASRRLSAMGRAAEASLRRALKDNPTLEQRSRIQALLARLKPVGRPQGDALRAVRAVAVLEWSNTAEARKILAEWAKRSSEARLADEASAALARLKYRSVARRDSGQD